MQWFRRLRSRRNQPLTLSPPDEHAPVQLVPVQTNTAVEVAVQPVVIDVFPIETPQEPAPVSPTEIEPEVDPKPTIEAAARARGNYFTPARYAGGSASTWLLSPDLLYQLRREAPRRLSSSTAQPVAEPLRKTSLPRPELLQYFTAGAATAAPLPCPPGAVSSIDPFQLALYFANAEGNPAVPEEASYGYLTEALLLNLGCALRDRVLENWLTGNAPLGLRALLDLALSLMPHTGTALLLCHNVTRAFSRGGAAIAWIKLDRLRGEYSNGRKNFLAAVLHPSGVLRSAGLPYPSLFYLLFSTDELSPGDPGDWYRLFASATVSWYAASLRVSAADHRESHVALTFENQLARQMLDSGLPSTPEYRTWAWLNAVSFTEQAIYGRSQKRAAAATRADLRGTVLGLSENGRSPENDWSWYVPRAGAWAARAPTLEYRADVAETLHEAGAIKA